MARFKNPFKGRLHKSFLERNQIVIGIISAAVVLGGSAMALLMSSGAFADQYKVTARFANAAGLKSGDDVTVAGLDAGGIESVEVEGGSVEVVLLVDRHVRMPADSTAEIVVETLMGKKSVALIAGGSEQDLKDGDVIPLARTTTPVELLDINNISTELLDKSDAGALNEFIDSLTKITSGKRAQVTQLVEGLGDAATAIDVRSRELARLIDSLDIVFRTFAERDETLVQLIDRLNIVLTNLDERRREIETLLRATDSASHEVADLVGRNRKVLDSTLSRLHTTLMVLNEHQTDLAGTISYLEDAVQGYASVGYSQGVPNRWANIFVQSLGPLGVDAIAGRCGTFDQALDTLLGPDPRYRCENGQAIETGIQLPRLPGVPGSGGGNAPRRQAGGGGAPAGGQSEAPGGTPLPGDIGDVLDSVTGTNLGETLGDDL